MTPTPSPVSYAKTCVPVYFQYTIASIKKTSQLAQQALTSPTSASFSSKPQDTAYDFAGKLFEAYEYLRTEENMIAGSLFKEIQQQAETGGLDKNSLIKAHCLLGLIYTNTTSHIDYSEVREAINEFNQNFEKNLPASDKELKSKAYLELRSCYKLLVPLIPLGQEQEKWNTLQVIDTLSKNIFPPDNFDETVKEADLYAQKGEYEQARQVYGYASSLSLPDEPRSSIQRIGCRLKLAQTYYRSSKSRETALYCLDMGLFQLFDDRDTIPKQLHCSKEEVCLILKSLFQQLQTLLPQGHSTSQAIQSKIAICMNESVKPGEQKPILLYKKGVRIFRAVIVCGLALIGAFTLSQRALSIIRS